MKKIIEIVWPPAFVYLINLTPVVQNLYSSTTWFDDIVHGIGGVSIAAATTLAARHYAPWWRAAHDGIKIFIGLCTTSFAAIAWEWYEFLSDTYLATHHQSSLSDTMFDQLDALIGAGIFMIIHIVFVRRYSKK